MSATTPAPSTASLDGLAALTAVLRDAAHLPGLLVYVTDEFGDNARAEARWCDSAPRIGIGAELLQEHRSVTLLGSMAHEVAHHALSHVSGSIAQVLERAAFWAYTAAVLAAVLPSAPVWGIPVLLGMALVAYLVARWRWRAAEYAADRHAVALLNGLGLPGRQVVTTMLAEDLAVEPTWYTLVGWLAGTHPPAISRLHRLSTTLLDDGSLQEVTP